MSSCRMWTRSSHPSTDRPPGITAFLLPSNFQMIDSGPSTLIELLHAAPAGRTAIHLPETGARITYGALREQVEGLADAFAAAGATRGERIALVFPNGVGAITGFLAAAAAGTAAPLNPGYRHDEFAFYLEDTAAKLLVVPPEGAEEAVRAAAGRIPVLALETGADGSIHVKDAGAVPSRKTPAPSPDDVALVLHTSGSTGRPKRVPLRHRHLATSARNIADTYQLTPNDVSLCLMPLFHVHGLVASVLSALLTGGTVVVPAKFNPLSFWRTVRDCGVTWYSAVPTIHQLVLARSSGKTERPAGAENLRFIRSCSAALPVEIAQKMEAAFGAPVLEAYGMTEAAHQMASNPLPPSAHKFGSVGPATGISIAIMNEAGDLLSSGSQGEVVIQGASVIQAYENNPEANAKSFVNGWFRTGDQGSLDAEGYLRLTGRLKEMINRGGEKIAPREIDEVLLAHPAVAEAVAFGIPHATWGEEVAAAVVLRDAVAESELIAHCRERLADFKTPRKIYVVTAIPRTATGKIQRLNVAAQLGKQG
jgi:oxalate---CoA ligase